jgi:hypothetical protein
MMPDRSKQSFSFKTRFYRSSAMRKLVAGFILMMALPMSGHAQEPGDVPRPPSEAMPSGFNPEQGTGSADEQNEAYTICLRATQLFEQQEKADGRKQPAEAPITASCKKELKPASYWRCMEKEAMQKTDFNTAHWRCAKQTNILK